MYLNEDMRIQMQRWMLMANMVVTTWMNHARREQRVAVIERMIVEAVRPNGSGNYGGDPVWAMTLISLLRDTRFVRHSGAASYIDHTMAKQSLWFFIEACQFMIEHWEADWFVIYRRRSDAIVEKSPFTVDVASDDLDDIPFGSTEESVEGVMGKIGFTADEVDQAFRETWGTVSEDDNDVFSAWLNSDNPLYPLGEEDDDEDDNDLEGVDA